MGFRFRKSIKLCKGVRLNINKNSIGLSVGTKGAHVSVNSNGRKTTTLSVPGTGVSYSKSSKISTNKQTTPTPQNLCETSEIDHFTTTRDDVIGVERNRYPRTKHPGMGWFFRIIGVILILLSLTIMMASPLGVLGVLLGIAAILYSGKQIGDDIILTPEENALTEGENVNE